MSVSLGRIKIFSIEPSLPTRKLDLKLSASAYPNSLIRCLQYITVSQALRVVPSRVIVIFFPAFVI